MGARFAGFQLERNGGDGQTCPHSGTFLCSGDPPCKGTQDPTSHGGHGHRSRARDETKTDARFVSITQHMAEIAASLRALLPRSVDYAGMFPPCQLDLEPALKNQAQYLRTADA